MWWSLSIVFGFVIHIIDTLITNSNSNPITPISNQNIGNGNTDDNQNLFHDPMSYISSHSSFRSKDELNDLVTQTNGYLARDYSLNLGWNNMRWIYFVGFIQ